MEWRFVYQRPEIWTIRESCVNQHTSVILNNVFQNFLNHYHGLCEKAKESPETFQIPPTWMQSSRHRNSKKFNRKNFHNNIASSPSSITAEQGHVHGDNENIWRTNESPSITRQVTPAQGENINPDFQKFLNTQWQPKVITPFESRLRSLRSIINKWTPTNFSECKGEFEKWWKEAYELGIWRCYFILQEWFLKINNERKPNNQWNFDFFQVLTSEIEWPKHRDSHVHQKMAENISNIHNSPWAKPHLLSSWSNHCMAKNEQGWYSQDYWKYWFTQALEAQICYWFIDEELKAPIDIWCSLISLFWWNQQLPAHFLPWSFLHPIAKISEMDAWKWRTTLWEKFLENENEYALRCRSWEKWKKMFFEMIPGIVDFHPEIWPLKLKFQWTDWNPDWKDIMQINDNKPVSSLPTSNTCSMPVLEICQEPKLPNEKETLENIRCLLNEWKEMGKQGWMDSYLPEYWLEGNKEVECSVWFTYYLYEAVQCLDDETFEVITRWIISQAGNENWVNLWKHEWEQNPPDWMIDFPKTEKYFDQITSWVCVVGNV